MDLPPSSSSPRSQLRTWERRLADAKKKHRPKLRNWSRDGFADGSNRRVDFQRISKYPSDIIELETAREASETGNAFTRVDRISCANLSPSDFIMRYERPALPVIIKDIPELEGWAAHEKWRFDNKDLFKRHLGMR
jgi:hypothetical protein